MNRFIMIQLFVFGNDVNEDVYTWTSKMCIPGLLSSRVSKCRTWIDIWWYLIFFQAPSISTVGSKFGLFNSSCPSDLQIKKPEEVKEVKDMSERNWNFAIKSGFGAKDVRLMFLFRYIMLVWQLCLLVLDVWCSFALCFFFCIFFLVCPSFFRSVFVCFFFCLLHMNTAYFIASSTSPIQCFFIRCNIGL